MLPSYLWMISYPLLQPREAYRSSAAKPDWQARDPVVSTPPSPCLTHQCINIHGVYKTQLGYFSPKLPSPSTYYSSSILDRGPRKKGAGLRRGKLLCVVDVEW